MSDPTDLIGGVAASRIAAIRAREAEAFAAARPRTRAALEAGTDAFLGGVPMLWMKDWPQPFPMLVAKAKGATLTDLDGNGWTISALAIQARCSAIRPSRSRARWPSRGPRG